MLFKPPVPGGLYSSPNQLRPRTSGWPAHATRGRTSAGLFEGRHDVAAGFKNGLGVGVEGRSCGAFCYLGLEAIYGHFCHIPFMIHESLRIE